MTAPDLYAKNRTSTAGESQRRTSTLIVSSSAKQHEQFDFVRKSLVGNPGCCGTKANCIRSFMRDGPGSIQNDDPCKVDHGEHIAEKGPDEMDVDHGQAPASADAEMDEPLSAMEVDFLSNLFKGDER